MNKRNRTSSELIWFWVATIELESKGILGISSIFKERNMLLSEQFVSSLVNKIQDSGSSTSSFQRWRRVLGIHPQACRFLRLHHHHHHHHLHSYYAKNIIIEKEQCSI
ncbi:MAG: hypothetical protein WCF06_14365 [Nitrososphaeraceae archaeon]